MAKGVKMPIQDDILPTLDKLIGYRTTADKPEEMVKCLAYLDRKLAYYPWIEKKYSCGGNRSQVWLTHDTLKPDVLLYVHIDVVPGSYELFTLKKRGNRLLGRGVCDMKFAAAVYVDVLRELLPKYKPNYSLGVVCVTDEERGGLNGIKYLVEKVGYKPKVVLMPDGGNDWHIVEEAKGAAWVRLTVKGKSAHASRPWEGKNAIAGLVPVLAYINKKYPSPKRERWTTTVNLGQVEGGTTPNQVADSASVVIDVRSVVNRNVDEVVGDIVKKYPNVAVDRLIDKSAFSIKRRDPYIDSWKKILVGKLGKENLPRKLFVREMSSADHHFFADVGASVVMSNPMGGLIHTEKEWLSESALYLYADVVSAWLKKLKI